jgi:hypothetical protein
MSKHAITHAKSNMKGDPERPLVPIIYKSYLNNVGFLNVIHILKTIKQNYLRVLGSR